MTTRIAFLAGAVVVRRGWAMSTMPAVCKALSCTRMPTEEWALKVAARRVGTRSTRQASTATQQVRQCSPMQAARTAAHGQTLRVVQELQCELQHLLSSGCSRFPPLKQVYAVAHILPQHEELPRCVALGTATVFWGNPLVKRLFDFDQRGVVRLWRPEARGREQ